MIGSTTLTQKAKLLYALVASTGGTLSVEQGRVMKALSFSESSLNNAIIELGQAELLSTTIANGLMTFSVHVMAEDQEIKKVHIEKESDTIMPEYDTYVEYLNKAVGKSYKGNKQTKLQFAARIKEGFGLVDFKRAIDNASKNDYHKENAYRWLTPSFFVRADKLDMWANAKEQEQKKRISHSDFSKTNLTNL